MRMKLRMVGTWGTFRTGDIINPTATLGQSLLENGLAVDATTDEPEIQRPVGKKASAKKKKAAGAEAAE